MANVLLIGMGPTALTALDSLACSFDVVGVVRKLGEGGADDPVAGRAADLGIPVHTDISLAAVDALVRRLKPDCVVVSSYNRVLRPESLSLSRFVNVHYAPLPQYRCRANVNWAIINGEADTAITIHTMSPGLDAGNILFQQRVPIGERDTVADLYASLNALQRECLGDTVRRFLDGNAGEPQAESDATYCCTRIPADGEIDWRATTKHIDRLVRALVEPFPGAYTYLNGKRLVVWKAVPVEKPPRYAGRVPGRVVGVDRSAGSVDVLTGDGILRICEIQHENSDRAAAAEIIRSVSDTLGLRTGDLAERVRSLERQVAELLHQLEE